MVTADWRRNARRARSPTQASYLKDSSTRVRKATTFPFSTFMSCLTTSAMRRSRRVAAAAATALAAASSQDLGLVPITSTTL